MPALAWGPMGHEVAAHLAARALTPKARAAVGRLLGGDAETMLVLDASWADEVRAERPRTASWHYVNVERDSAGYDARRDCPQGDCVVAQIGRDTAILKSRAPAPVKAEALKFLIHFTADMHQPLHVADDHDRGGNNRMLFYRGNRVSLHHLWDDDVVRAQDRDPARLASVIGRGLTPAQRRTLAAGRPADWADDSFHVAQGIYDGLHGNRLPDDYARRQGGLVRLQLAKAGLRLAAILNAVFR